MSWNAVDYIALFISISPFFIMIIYWIVSGIRSRYGISRQRNIEQLERMEKFVKKYSYDYDAEPMRDEKGRMTRIPSYSSESYFPNHLREEYGLPPIKNDIDSICIGDRVFVYFRSETEDGKRKWSPVIGTLEERKKMFDPNHPSNGEYAITIRCDNGERFLCYEKNAVLTKVHTEVSDKKGEKYMTCRELLTREHPEKIDPTESGGCVGCPSWYGYMCEAYLGGENCLRDEFITNDNACRMCWNRDVSGTLEKTDKLYRDAMEISVSAMRNYTGSESIPLEPDRKEKYKDAALEYKALYDAMMDAGFDSNKAFLLTKTIVAKTFDTKVEVDTKEVIEAEEPKKSGVRWW